MAEKRHTYQVHLNWMGAGGSFRNHDRSYELSAPGKPPIAGSSDAVFRGDSTKWNPEDLLVASLCACHQLWYLGLCAAAGIVVTGYEDDAEGVMVEASPGGAGQFEKLVLRPRVTLAPGSDLVEAARLHDVAHSNCFIARSVNFPVTHDAIVEIA
jgi:organic hydroperoxide reductase OsmC/OhrA